MDDNTTTVSIAAMGIITLLYSAMMGLDGLAKATASMLIGVAVDRLYVNRAIKKGRVPKSILADVNKYLDRTKES